MNQHIKELAEQAETKEMGYYFFDREKFAEAIVRECIQVLKDTGYPNAHGNYVGVEEIKQHFGVN